MCTTSTVGGLLSLAMKLRHAVKIMQKNLVSERQWSLTLALARQVAGCSQSRNHSFECFVSQVFSLLVEKIFLSVLIGS